MKSTCSISTSILFFSLFYFCSSGCTARTATDNSIGATTIHSESKPVRYEFDGAALGDSMDDVLGKWGFTEADIQEDRQFTNADWLKQLSGTLPANDYQALISEWNDLVPKVYALAKGSGVDRRPVKKNNVSYLAYFDSGKRLQRYVVIVKFPENTKFREVLQNSFGVLEGRGESENLIGKSLKQLEQQGKFLTKQQIENGGITIAAAKAGDQLTVKYSALGYIRDVETHMKEAASRIQSKLMKKYGLAENR